MQEGRDVCRGRHLGAARPAGPVIGRPNSVGYGCIHSSTTPWPRCSDWLGLSCQRRPWAITQCLPCRWILSRLSRPSASAVRHAYRARRTGMLPVPSPAHSHHDPALPCCSIDKDRGRDWLACAGRPMCCQIPPHARRPFVSCAVKTLLETVKTLAVQPHQVARPRCFAAHRDQPSVVVLLVSPSSSVVILSPPSAETLPTSQPHSLPAPCAVTRLLVSLGAAPRKPLSLREHAWPLPRSGRGHGVICPGVAVHESSHRFVPAPGFPVQLCSSPHPSSCAPVLPALPILRLAFAISSSPLARRHSIWLESAFG